MLANLSQGHIETGISVAASHGPIMVTIGALMGGL